MTREASIEILVGDITKLDVEAVVNAANERLFGGGGVDGAIHQAAGPRLLDECAELMGCPTGQAKITNGYELPANYVIHAVGPVWKGGDQNEDELLASCYVHALRLAQDHGCGSVAFPAISTGAYGFPKDRAARIALETTLRWLEETGSTMAIKFCCFSEEDAEVYRGASRRQAG